MATNIGTAGPASGEPTRKADTHASWVVDLQSGRIVRREPPEAPLSMPALGEVVAKF